MFWNLVNVKIDQVEEITTMLKKVLYGKQRAKPEHLRTRFSRNAFFRYLQNAFFIILRAVTSAANEFLFHFFHAEKKKKLRLCFIDFRKYY